MSGRSVAQACKTWVSLWLRASLLAIALAVAALPARADIKVDLELVLAVDASRSIDAFEYRLQRMGYAKALIHPTVIGAITSGPLRRIAVSYVEWSGAVQQATLVGWTVIDGKASAAAFAEKLTAAPRRFLGGTSISGAIGYSLRMFHGNGIRGTRRVIDISGDGPNNRGVPSVVARDAAVRAGITINGLAILNDRPSRPPWPEEPVDIHYKTKVIGGPGAFMMVVKGFDAFAAAIRNKLIREIAEGGAGRSAREDYACAATHSPCIAVTSVRNTSQPGDTRP